MVDKFLDPLLSRKDTARHLVIPSSTLNRWLGEEAAGSPLVHGVEPEHVGWPSVPFVAVVEAYVLRSLRDLGLSMNKIRDAAAEVRNAFGTEFGLATRKIATDGIDIFLDYAPDDIARVGDRQRPIREVLDGYLHYIEWDADDNFASRLKLRQYPAVVPVVIDPRFGRGSPVVAENNVPVEAIVTMWQAGETIEEVAYEYELDPVQVESICRVWRAA
ncbi:DUF433 domain-containing protein [Umezawaea sp. NPDC059074]|uniref:DUF433 domain-containing protein n=1 Tax=Umezawaea sp. NPDC059074 TaxID=3346716 RepID=UPI0036B4A6BF